MEKTTRSRFLAITVTAAAALLWAAPPSPAQQCDCTASICSSQGFVISLTSFSVDQNNGTSAWTYEICNDAPNVCDCQPEDKNPAGQCKGLSHIDIDLPALGSCLTAEQQITFSQVGGVAAAQLSCSVSEKDPSCDLTGTAGTDFVAKCNVGTDANPQSLDPGECVQMQLTIAGEEPTLGHGGATTVTKAATICRSDSICGPACDCGGEDVVDPCLTRSPGFWGTHPAITSQFLPITVCGETLSTTDAGSCSSATEALCVSPGFEANKKLDRNPSYAQLVRQLAAAKLNLAASAANDGTCDGFAARVAECEGFCDASKNAINHSGCLADLDQFNNSQDTLTITPSPFDAPGPAQPSQCQDANGNGIVIGKRCF